jgi:hypothetical protein
LEQGVSEGNNVSPCSKTHLPEAFATTECEKSVLTLINFEVVDVSKIPLPAPKTTEDRAKEISNAIVLVTRLSQPIHVFCLVGDEESRHNAGPPDSSSAAFWIEGTAMKGENATWNIILSNGNDMTMTTKEMLTSPNVFVQNACLELDSTERQRTILKKKRIRASEKRRSEKERIRKATKKQKEEGEEFEMMKLGVESGEQEFSDFQKLVDWMRAPFNCEIEGVNVRVSPDSAAVMFDDAALGAMKQVLVKESEEEDDNNNNNNNNNGPPRKRRRNTAAAETGLGLGCDKAHC